MTELIPDIITIKGAPGTGKTLTSKCLAEYYPAGVRLEIDTLRSMVISVEWANQEEHIRMLDLSADLVLGFHHQGYRPIIVVDTFSGDKLDRYLAVLRGLNESFSIRSFALVTDADELKRRLDNRHPDEFKDFEVSLKLNATVLERLHPAEKMIDTTHSSPIETAKGIFRSLQHTSYSSPDIPFNQC